MKKANLIFLGIVGLALVIYFFGTKYGLQVGDTALTWNQDKNVVERKTHAFLEDVTFKDFKKALRKK